MAGSLEEEEEAGPSAPSRGRGLSRKKSLGRSRSIQRSDSTDGLEIMMRAAKAAASSRGENDNEHDGETNNGSGGGESSPRIRRVRRVKGSNGDSATRGSVTRIKVRRTKSGDGMDEQLLARQLVDKDRRAKKTTAEEAENDHNGGNNNNTIKDSDNDNDELPVRRKIGRSKSSDGIELMRERELRGPRGGSRRHRASGVPQQGGEAAPEMSRHAAENLRRLAGGAITTTTQNDDTAGETTTTTLSSSHNATATAPPLTRRGRGTDAPRRGVARTKSHHRPRSVSPTIRVKKQQQQQQPSQQPQQSEDSSDDDEGEEKKTRGGKRPARGGGGDDKESGGGGGGPYYSITQLRERSVEGLDYDNREQYLTPQDFKDLFGCTKEEYDEMPKWKQQKAKRLAELF